MTPTFKVIDKQTGRKYSEKNINTDGLMEMDLDQMFLGEDGSLVMADDCNNITYQDRERFEVVIDGYVAVDKVLEIIDQMDRENEECNEDPARSLLRIEHQDFREMVLALKGGEHETITYTAHGTNGENISWVETGGKT